MFMSSSCTAYPFRRLLWEMTVSYLLLFPRPPTPPFPCPQLSIEVLQLSSYFSEEMDIFPFVCLLPIYCTQFLHSNGDSRQYILHAQIIKNKDKQTLYSHFVYPMTFEHVNFLYLSPDLSCYC